MMQRSSAALMAGLACALAAVLAGPLAAQGQVQFRSPTPAEAQAQAQAQTQATLDRFARARDNLIALREGRRSVNEFSPQELQDVLDLDLRVRGNYPDTRSPRQRCVDDEVRRARGEPSALEWQVIRLKCRD